MSHFAIKLNCGDFIFCTIEDEIQPSSKVVLVKNPMIMEEYVSDDGESRSALIAYCLATDEDTTGISISNIISINKLSNEFKEYYDAAVQMQYLSKQKLTSSLKQMTKQMHKFLLTEQDKQQAMKTNSIVATNTESNSIH